MKRRTLLQGGTLALCLGQTHIAWGEKKAVEAVAAAIRNTYATI